MLSLTEILGYIMALLIGLVLGLIGGGGSILTVPVLVYIMHINPVLATAYSLFVVGISALMGTIRNFFKKQISLKTAFVFAVPSFLAVYLTRLYLLPMLPQLWINSEGFILTKGQGLMLIFALIMIMAAIPMLKGRGGRQETCKKVRYAHLWIVIEGFGVGILTGLVGAGGGFLIVPALVLLARLPMKIAVGTSLLIIAIKSLIGFIGDIQAGQNIQWDFLIVFTSFAIIGIFLGGYLSQKISGTKLKKGFAYFVLVMAFFILAKELI